MCVGAALGLSKVATGSALISQATAFNIGLGLTVANSFMQRAAAQDLADQTYQMGLEANLSAEDDKRQKQLALAEQKEEKEKAAAQDKFARTIETMNLQESLIASERSGLTTGLLLRDFGLQGANYRESVNQSLESMQRQYLFNIQATESELLNRRNKIQSNINTAYSNIPSLGETLVNIGVGALGNYTSALSIPA